MKGAAVFLVVLAVVSLEVVLPVEAVSCTDVRNALLPCISFATGADSQPSGSCCSGIKNLAGGYQAAERQAACECIKSAVGKYHLEVISSLPGKCGVAIGDTLGPNMDCSKYAVSWNTAVFSNVYDHV
ncbi:non-specific lipid-transfer protein 4.1-like [Andrographis paniculata]|uniref:non-specific lipid-transfer protein 4.1-like n=1 Tax=Andrographis paniculata TaxID=175694 RepID=UPI0021E87DD2|nr:non-specific lipid-transfer protein 4.1-like [Andrographis paniculata]